MPTKEISAESTAPAAVPRKRGRPRTVLDENQVPERRRKQLRVAQQAYRRRKETAITNLQTRVQELESGIEDLSHSFLSFSNLLLDAHVLERHPRIASALQDITQQCVSLAKRGCDDLDGEDLPQDAPSDRRDSTTTPEMNQEVEAEFPLQESLLLQGDNPVQSSAALVPWPHIPTAPAPTDQEQAILPFGIVLESPMIPFFTPMTSSPVPATTISPGSARDLGRWTISHQLVRECCQNGYQLLLNCANDSPRIIQIFGTPLSTMDRNRLLSGFYMAINDEGGDLIERRTTVLHPMTPKTSTLSPNLLGHIYRAWQLMLKSGDDQLLDASGVQRLLQEKGIRIQGTDSASSSTRVEGWGYFNVAAFVKLLSLGGVCVGPGPAFRRRDVENALNYASSH
ncbi:bZIP transcription factor bZIP-1, partial [Penicillium capsulatum]